MQNDAPPLAPGRLFGGAFTLLRPIGAGGAASVWLAREDALGREVALKVPARTDPAARGRFLVEARALAAVRHPGVVAVLRWGEDPATGLPFFAMPVHPATLADRFAREPRLPEADAAALGLALVPALAALHAAGIAHRDLKPSNVLLDASGAPVLADPCGPRGGTPAWAAPEQLAGENENSSLVTCHSSLVPAGGAAADWHALGLLLYRALAGALPPPHGILPAAIEPPRGSLPRDLRPRPSRGWEPLLRALLDPDPARRLSDPAAILRALRRLRRRALLRARLRQLRRPALVALVALAAAALLAAVLRTASVPAPAAPEPLSAARTEEANVFKALAERSRREHEEAMRRIFEEPETTDAIPAWVLEAQAEQDLRQASNRPAWMKNPTPEGDVPWGLKLRQDSERAFQRAMQETREKLRMRNPTGEGSALPEPHPPSPPERTRAY